MSMDEENLKKRQFVVNEIVSTERTYVNRLKIAIEVYAQPMRAGKILDSNDCSSQFQVLEELLNLHYKHTINDEEINIENLFNDISNNFKIYSEYLVNYEPAMQRRGSLMISNRKYSDFLDKVMKDPKSQFQNIESLLIMPVQRIPRYRLLLEQLLKYTPEDHPEFLFVKSALDKICNVAMFNNEAIRARENKTKMMAIMMQIEPRTRIDLLDDSSRQFIMEAPLQRQCRRGLKEFTFWLFNDKLLYGQAVPLARDIFILNREIPLSKCFVKKFDSIYDANLTFMVESPAKSFIVRAKDEAERNDWLKAISDAVQKQRERISHQRGSVAPLWIPDATASECQKCRTKFTLINRRHHCRNCGVIVCDSCSNQRHLISHVDQKKEVRVCAQCHYLLNSKDVGTSQNKDELGRTTIGADEYYESDEDDEGNDAEEITTRGTVTEDQLNDFNEHYDDVALKSTNVSMSSPSYANTAANANSPGVRPPITKRPSIFAGGGAAMSSLISDMSKKLTPIGLRTRTTFNFGPSQNKEDSLNSPVSPADYKTTTPSDDSSPAAVERKENPVVVSIRKNAMFNACGEAAADSDNAFGNTEVDQVVANIPPAVSATMNDGDTSGGTAPIKPPKPTVTSSSGRAARRTNLCLKPEDMPKDIVSQSDN